jgi:hypothetical protein
MQPTRLQKIAYSLIGLLVVILLGVVIYTQLIAGGEERLFPLEDVETVGGLRPDEARQPFDVGILQNPQYTSLNRSLLDAGRLPVPPPSSRGKPNLFGL